MITHPACICSIYMARDTDMFLADPALIGVLKQHEIVILYKKSTTGKTTCSFLTVATGTIKQLLTFD